VARLAGVDPSLVSRIVNNDPRAASTAETRQRVLDAVQSLGYRPSVAARGLRMARTMTAGLLLPDLSNPMYVSVVRGVEKAARELGYGVVIGSQIDSQPQDELTRLLTDGRVDGLLVASGSLHDDLLRDVAVDGPGPVVLVNRHVDGVPASVTVDDAAGAALAVAHLASLGHRSITAFFGPTNIDTTIRRQEGFRIECARQGVEGVEVEAGSWTAEAGYRVALGALSLPTLPTAIFASTFAMGLGALRAAREAGVPVPERLSVITLHDTELADYSHPPLTAIAMPSEEMGSEAMRLLDRMANGGKPDAIVVDSPPVLSLRGSTSPPPD
jgi:LacI family transcriptional regulator